MPANSRSVNKQTLVGTVPSLPGGRCFGLNGDVGGIPTGAVERDPECGITMITDPVTSSGIVGECPSVDR
jgi:hypothetical protein